MTPQCLHQNWEEPVRLLQTNRAEQKLVSTMSWSTKNKFNYTNLDSLLNFLSLLMYKLVLTKLTCFLDLS